MATRHQNLNGEAFPDWRDTNAYRDLIGADGSAFAWEWLRRTRRYWNAWLDSATSATSPQPFGLERFEDPALSVPRARPVWCRATVRDALTAHVASWNAPQEDRIDLRLLSPLVTIVIDGHDIEHVLLSDGRMFLRIDIVEGTLIGCPSALTFLMRGLTNLRGPIKSLDRLQKLVKNGDFRLSPAPDRSRFERWIRELRVADAMRDGQPQQEMARTLFGSMVSQVRWREDSPSFRRRVQRLVVVAGNRLRDPLDGWF